MAQNSCSEYTLKDVVRVDVYRMAHCRVVSPMVPDVLFSADASFTDAPLCSFALSVSGGENVMEIDTAPTVKGSVKYEANGKTYTYEMQVTFPGDISEVKKAVCNAGMDDLGFLATLEDGSRHFAGSLPNTSQLTIDESLGTGANSTLKLSLTNLCGLVMI